MVSVDGQPIHSTPKVHDIINSNGGKPVDVVSSRNGKLITSHLTPAISTDNGTKEWLIGVKLQPKVVLVSLPFPEALKQSVRENAKNATFIYQFLRGVAEREREKRVQSAQHQDDRDRQPGQRQGADHALVLRCRDRGAVAHPPAQPGQQPD